MIFHHRRSSTVALVLLLAACSGTGAESASRITMRDSAGITIVEHPAGALAEAPVFTLGEATTTVGGPEADEDHDATSFSPGWLIDGGFLTLNRQQNRFHKFGLDGTLLGSFGRRGEGPGEFRFLGTGVAGGDSVMVIEMTRGTVQYLRPDLTITEPVRVGEPMQFRIQPIGRLADGSLIALYQEQEQPKERSGPPRREPQKLLRMPPGATTWDTMMIEAGPVSMPHVFREGDQEYVALRPVTFGAFPMRGIWNGSLIHIDNDAWTLTVHDTTGTPTRQVRLAESRRPVDAAMRDSTFARDVRAMSGVNAPESVKETFIAQSRDQVFADSVAPWDRILPARDGSVWIRTNETPADSSTWWYNFSREGHLTRRLEILRGWSLFSVDGDRALIRRTDDDDIGILEIRTLVGPARD